MGRLFAMIVAVSGVSAAVFIYFFMTDLERFNRKAKIEAEVASVTSLFSERIRNAQILQDTYKALYEASEFVSKEEFETFADSLQSHVSPLDKSRAIGTEYGWIGWENDRVATSFFASANGKTSSVALEGDRYASVQKSLERLVGRYRSHMVFGSPFAAEAERAPANAITLLEPVLTHHKANEGGEITRNDVRGFIFATIDMDKLLNGLTSVHRQAASVTPVELKVGDADLGPTATYISKERITGRGLSPENELVHYMWIDDWRFDLKFAFLDPATETGFLKQSILLSVGVLIGTLFLVSYILVVDQQKREFRRARIAAEQANEAKDRFLANMTHELRTPMSGIIGMARLISKSSLDHKQQSFMSKLISSAETLMSTINDILDLSKLDSNKMAMDLEPADIDECLRSAIVPLKLLAEEKQLTLALNRVGPPLTDMLIDEMRLRQVITNLVGNAIKFTERGGIKVRLDSRSPENEDGFRLVQISVEDSGVGIPLEMQERIFEQFTQADISTTKQFGGTGLGLAISRNLIEAMNGRISVESQPGVGSTFTFSIPVARAQDARPAQIVDEDRPPAAISGGSRQGAAADDAADPNGPRSRNVELSAPPRQVERIDVTGLRVLLVEDDPINRLFAEEILTEFGAEVSIATDGLQGVEMARAGECDVILMDCQMPVMDGFDAAREISGMIARGELAPTPIIALTANALNGDRERCLNAGMNEYITKPLDDMCLMQALIAVGVARTRKPAPGANSSRPVAPAMTPIPGPVAPPTPTRPAVAVGRPPAARPVQRPVAQGDGPRAAPAPAAAPRAPAAPVSLAPPAKAATRVQPRSGEPAGKPVVARPAIATATATATVAAPQKPPAPVAKPVADKTAPRQAPAEKAAASQAPSTRAAGAAPSAPEASSVIDFAQLDVAKRRMKAKFPQMVRIFIEDSRRQIATIEKRIDEGSVDDVARLAHTIKGSSRLIGATLVSEAAVSLEGRFKDVEEAQLDFNQARFDCDHLKDRLDDAHAALDAMLTEFRAA